MTLTQHFDISTYPVKDTIKLLTALLEKITQTNDLINMERKKSNYTCFHARSIPSISIQAYFNRIVKYCPCANECLLAILVYFDRMTETKLHIDSYNIHRLIITGLMISSKLYSDNFFTNTRYAKVGGLPVAELNSLELEFLRLNNYSLFVDIETLQIYGDKILDHWNQTQQVESLAVQDNILDESFNKMTVEDKQWMHNKQQIQAKKQSK